MRAAVALFMLNFTRRETPTAVGGEDGNAQRLFLIEKAAPGRNSAGAAVCLPGDGAGQSCQMFFSSSRSSARRAWRASLYLSVYVMYCSKEISPVPSKFLIQFSADGWG